MSVTEAAPDPRTPVLDGPQQELMALFRLRAVRGVVRISFGDIERHTSIPGGSIFSTITALEKKGWVRRLYENGKTRVSGYSLIGPEPQASPHLSLVPVEAAPTPMWKGGARQPSKNSVLSRFGSVEPDPASVRDLREDHPALVQDRTIFPSSVKSAWDTERLLVSGHNNPKLGAEVQKGPWAGMPLYHLTLEERATCPRSCAMWRGCYGNAMHLARRHDHRDPLFLTLLESEMWLLARQHQGGFVVRLHTLGDFFSVEYVRFWEEALRWMPQLRVFGYTANRPDAQDFGERAIGQEIERLTESGWDRFAIRFSGGTGFQGSVVLDEPSQSSNIVMCPAQYEATTACSTCGLCWAKAAREKTIGFLRHGMKRRGAAE